MEEAVQQAQIVEEAERSVRVKLRAAESILQHLSLEKIEDTPSIAIPSNIGRSGLSSVVHHFLTEIGVQLPSTSVQFEFNDNLHETLLKGTLEKHLKKYKLTEEDVLVLEYAFPKFTKFVAEGPGAPVPDWISSLSVLEDVVIAGTFDGCLVTNCFEQSKTTKGEELVVKHVEKDAHQTQITSVSCFKLQGNPRYYAASASKDASVAIRQLNNDLTVGKIVATCVTGQGKSIETVATANSSDDTDDVLLACAGWSADVYLFQVNCNSDDAENASSRKSDKSGKRQREPEQGQVYQPVYTMRGHTDKISSVKWSGPVDPVTLFTASWDHSLRVWDCVRQVETAALHAQKPFTSIDYLQSKEIVASGHPDHVVRLWDARASGDAVVKLSIKGHRGWVSSVAFQGGESTLLASASYDRTVKVWDIRGGVCLQTIQTDVTGRLFSVVWGSDGRLLLGGSDATIRSYVAEAVSL